MNTQVFSGGDAGLIREVNAWVTSRREKYNPKTLFLPTGSTPVPLFKAWEKEKPAFLRGLQLSQLDEVVTGPETGVFKRFFADILPSFASQFMDFEKVQGPPDLVILGIGMNGHVAFHEPHVPADHYRGVVVVADEDCDAMKMPRGTKADTFGVASFLQSKSILLLARGKSKRELMNAMKNDPTASFPAAHLRKHPDFTVLMDEEASGA